MTRTCVQTSTMLLLLASLSACGGGSRPRVSTPPPPSGVSASDVDTAFDLMLAGKTAEAHKLLDRLIKRDPMSANARLLLESLDHDAVDLLGPSFHPYLVRAGDTPAILAEHLLGNRLLAYQLIRYNGLNTPAVLTPGQVLRVPGEPVRAEPVRRPEPPARAIAPPPSASAKPKTAAPKPTPAPVANPVAARAARAAGLAALNAGDISRAIGLLRRAAALDPTNPVIARDLARAQRIAATVRAHH